MNLHHLRIFRSVAKVGSTVAAADQLLISQSAVSSQLKQLEVSLKTALFERVGRGLVLTEAGRMLLIYADRIFVLADEAAASIDSLKGLKQGRLALGATPVIGTYFLPPVLVHFQRRFPGVELMIEIEEHPLLQQRLQDGLIEIAFTPVAESHPQTRTHRFMQDELVAVVAVGHPLAGRTKKSANDLAQSFIVRRPPSAIGSLSSAYFLHHKVNLKPIISLGSVEAVKQAAAAGLGATILPRMAVQAEISQGRLCIVNAAGLPLRRPLFDIRLDRQPSKAAIAFDCLLKHAVRGTLPKLKLPASSGAVHEAIKIKKIHGQSAASTER